MNLSYQHPYSLHADHLTSEVYYQTVRQVAHETVHQAESSVWPLIQRYKHDLNERQIEAARTDFEYLIEILMIGVFWNVYHRQAFATSISAARFLARLAVWRLQQKWLKPGLDAVRGRLMSRVLLSPVVQKKTTLPRSPRGLSSLLQWLEASGDFREEAKRLRLWHGYFTRISETEAQRVFDACLGFAAWFTAYAQAELGCYTIGVASFLQYAYPSYYGREDVIFCGRKEVEYHLNMAGAELMNQAFFPEFSATSRKVVLLPGCMRLRPAEECQALRNGYGLTCVACTPACQIASMATAGKSRGVEVYIIPHSSDFTVWLQRWRDQSEIGVVAVACVLNLLAGGYEMRALNIPAQCVLLDYCGCQRHWHPRGIPTQINPSELWRVIGC